MTASSVGLAAGLFQTARPGASALAICRHGVVLLPRSEKAKVTAFPQHLNPLPCPVGQLVNAASTFLSSSAILVNDFRPSHPTKAFDLARSAEPPPAVVPVLPSTLLPAFHWPELHYYYGFICHLAPIVVLAFTLIHNLRQCPDSVSGFPGYCTGSLSTMPPSNTAQA